MEAYKTGQGSLARLSAAFALFVAALLGCVELYSWIHDPRSDRPLFESDVLRRLPVLGVPFSWKFLLCLALFVAFAAGVRKLLARPASVDTLIETEAELRKVSWPTTEESRKATAVVIGVSLLITLVLFLFDVVLRFCFDLVF
ncbi:MAG: preprotein translocase subunit SecE [Planctomycetota bacterium]